MDRSVTQLDAALRTFTQLLSSTRRGARLARLLGVAELRRWGVPQNITERAEIVVAELAANAALHGRVPGRSFRLTLAFDPSAARLRVEVTDARGELWPHLPPPETESGALRTCGHGLSLVAALADHWDTVPYPPSGKTVRAVLQEGISP
ncbi:ATP-binding protein [Streptomyces sp. 891-h]|uniref:ATP-binding protein n=1 Tax=unclassified Streptomyces TaxID=2593676 RepID=UPI001FAAB39A|nr:ATP-binding protein [Streptomyces sp. 891-h]UNZ16906.1 ATP-binding protein [Streptomyces sp. 891-h]